MSFATIINCPIFGSWTLTLGEMHNAFESIRVRNILWILNLILILILILLLLVDKCLLELHLLLHLLLLIGQYWMLTRLLLRPLCLRGPIRNIHAHCLLMLDG